MVEYYSGILVLPSRSTGVSRIGFNNMKQFIKELGYNLFFLIVGFVSGVTLVVGILANNLHE